MTRIWEVLFSRDASARLLTDFVESVSDATAPASRIAVRTSARAARVDETAERLRHDVGQRLALFQVARSMRPEIQRTMGGAAADPRAHCVWLGGTGRLAPALEPLAHLLAASIASQFDECVVVVSLSSAAARVTVYHRDDAFEIRSALGTHPGEAEIAALLARDPALPPFRHVLWVRPEAPDEPPHALGAQPFDRVVHLDTTLPRELPRSLETRLKQAARNASHPSEPLFSSFVPTVVGPSWPDLDGGHGFASWDHAHRTPGWRRMRDACRLDVDPLALAREWERWSRSRASLPFVVHVERRLPDVGAWVDRWARAVTNRRVGVALSGGGASSYRFVEPLRRFAAPDPGARSALRPTLPVDVLSGVSGGTLLGAYFAAGGVAGLERALDDGWLLQGAVLGFVLRSQLVEQVVRWRVGDGSLAGLPIRFVPVAVGLPAGRPPETRVLTHFRLGEAVRASGALPVGFGQTTIRGERYADGGFGALLPAQVLKDYGADFVVGLNCIPGPAAGDPLYGSALVDLVRRWTPIGRLIDLWVALAYLIQESSQLAGQVPFVHELVEPSPTSVPLVELAQFAWARDIAAGAAGDRTFMEGVERCVELWRDFRSWDVPGTGWSVAAADGAEAPAAQPIDRDRIEGGDMAETQEITDILESEDLARLKKAYRRETVVTILRDVTPRKYKVAQQYFSAVTDTFYPLSDVPGIGEFRAALGIADRQRCILALQAAAGQEAPLAIHVYVSLMEGISPAEIANILLLAGVYTGVPNFFAGLEVLEATLELLAEKVRAGVVEPLPVLLAVQETFGPRGGRPPEGTPAPARRLRSV